jgi:hypothetical protein
MLSSFFLKIKRSSVAFNPGDRDRTVSLATTLVDASSVVPTTTSFGGNVSADWVFSERSDGTLMLHYKNKAVHAFQGAAPE